MTCRSAGSKTQTSDLIRYRAGVEIPAGGTWTIASGQTMTAKRRGRLRSADIAVRTTGGALAVSADLATVTFELGLGPDRTSRETAPAVDIEGALIAADRIGRWRFGGTVTIEGAVSPIEVALVYQGVHARGAAPVVWLTVAEMFLVTDRGRRRRPAGLRISGDLNACRDDAGTTSLPAIGRSDRSVLVSQDKPRYHGRDERLSITSGRAEPARTQ